MARLPCLWPKARHAISTRPSRSREIDRELERDPARNRAELLAEFRTDITAFVDRAVVEKCITHGVRERPFDKKLRYRAFCDPSGGSRDSFTLCIGHYDTRRQTVTIDCLRERRPPFSPEMVCEEFAKVLRSYRVYTVLGDRYGGEWPREQFRKFGVNYQPADKPKSELYIDTLPLINSCRLELLDEPRSINQLCNLECRTARGGRDTIDHPPNGQDDCANVIAGCAAILAEKGGYDPAGAAATRRNQKWTSRKHDASASSRFSALSKPQKHTSSASAHYTGAV